MPAVMAYSLMCTSRNFPPAMSPSWLLQTWRNCNKFDLHCQGIRSAFGTHLQFNQHRHMFGFPCHHPFTCHFHQHFWSKAQLGFNSLWNQFIVKVIQAPFATGPLPIDAFNTSEQDCNSKGCCLHWNTLKGCQPFWYFKQRGLCLFPLPTSSVFKNSVRHPRFQSFYSHGNKCQIREGGSLTCRQAPALVTGVTERRAPINPWWNGSAWLWEVAWYYFLVVGNVNYLLAENIFLASKLVTKKTGALSMCKNYGKSQQRANKYEANSNFIFTS